MFTKTGLRPREIHGLEARPAIGKKLPPVTSTHRRSDFHAGSSGVSPAMSSTRRKKAGGRSSSSGSRSRREIYRHGGGGSRSRSAGGKGEISHALRAHRATRKRPEWDDSLRDTSQYRLTAEEALRRKISLVSKHNTLVFGLGGGVGGCASKNAAASSSVAAAAAAAAEVARGHSSKQLQHKHQPRSRKVRGDGASVVSSGSGGSSVLAVYGGGGSGGGKGKAAVLESTAETEADLTAAISEKGGSPACATGGENDATMSLYTNHGGDACLDAHGGEGDRRSAGGSGSGSGSGGCDGDDANEVESSLPEGGGSASGREASGGSSSLADLEVGIKAFSKRVGRLETFRKADLLENETAGGNRSGTESDFESQGKEEADCRSRHQPDEVLLVHDGSISDNLLSPGTAKHGGGSGSGGHLLSAATEHGDGSEAHHRHQDRPASNPWSYGAPSSSSSSFRERRRRSEAAPQRSSSKSDGDGKGEVGLVKRIELLEARVLGMCSASSPVIPDANPLTAGSSNGNQKALPHQIGCGTTTAAGAAGREHIAREEQLRGVVVDLLSLSAALLARATEAERRLCELGRGGKIGVDGVSDGSGVHDRARRVRVSAEAAVVPASGGGEIVPATTGEGGARTDSTVAAAANAASASSLPGEVVSPPSGGGPRRAGSPTPHRSTTPRSTATDCWGEALDAVGLLVDSQSSGFGLDETACDCDVGTTAAATVNTCLLPIDTGGRLGGERGRGDDDGGGEDGSYAPGLAEVGSLQGQPLPQRPLQNAGNDSSSGGVARVYRRRAAPQDGAVSAALLLDAAGATMALAATDGAAGENSSVFLPPGSPWVALQEIEGVFVGGGGGEEKEGEEEEGRASPAFSAPNPSKMPRHPFGGERSGPLRLPAGVRRQVGQARGEPVSESGPRRGAGSCFERGDGSQGGGGRSGEGERGGGGGGDSVRKAPRPPIGQWYTPPSLALQD